MSRITFKDRMPQFKRSLYNVLDDALAEAAKDTLIDAKNSAPFKKGGLRRDSVVSQVAKLRHRVSFNVEYARFQELGGDNKRTVRNYTTSGTGKSFLKSAGDKQIANLKVTMRKHASRARA